MQITTAKLKNADGSFEYLGIGADANYITLKNGENFEEAASEVNNNTSNMDLTYQILDKELKTSIPVDVELNRNIAEFSSRDPQTNVIKTSRAKVKNEDGWSEDIPIAAAAVNIDLNNGNNAEDTFENLEVKLNELNEKYDELKSLVSTVVEGDPVTVDSSGMDYMDTIIYGNSYQTKLPNEYQEVEYIKSTGTQYIDTRIVATSSINIEAYVKLWIYSKERLFGASNNNYKYEIYCTADSSLRVFYHNVYRDVIKLQSVLKEYIIEIKQGKVFIDNVLQTERTDTFDTELNLYLFASNINNYADYYGKDIFLEKFKIYDNNILVRDFIPCYRKSDNEIGLYDLVNNEFYTNQGTGTFIKGNDIPNPDYPQDIEVIDGMNKFNSELELGTIDANGYKGESTIRVRSDFNEIEPNIKYTISSSNDTLNIVPYYYDKNGLFISFDNGWKEMPFIFTTPSNCYKVKFLFKNSDDTIEVNDVTELQLIKGTIEKPYLPYGYIGLEQSGKNLISIDTQERTTEGITTIKTKNKFVLNGTSALNWVDLEKLYNIFIPKGTTITFSRSNNEYNLYLRFVQSDGGVYRFAIYDGSYSTTITLPQDVTGMRQFLQGYTAGDVFTDYEFETQLEYGDIATEIEQPKESIIYPIDLQGNSIAKTGDVKDLLRIYRNGDVEIEKKINNTILDGSENWGFHSINSYGIANFVYNHHFNSIDDYGQQKRVKLSHFITQNTLIANEQKEGCLWQALVMFIRLKETRANNLASFKTWLSNNNVTIYYELKAPQTIQLSSINPIELWEGTNIFKLITNLDTTMQVDYYKNYEKYVISNIDF